MKNPVISQKKAENVLNFTFRVVRKMILHMPNSVSCHLRELKFVKSSSYVLRIPSTKRTITALSSQKKSCDHAKNTWQ